MSALVPRRWLWTLALGLSVSALAQESPCLECHDDLDAPAMAASVHGFLECSDCHSGGEEFPHSDGVLEVECSLCHDDAAQALQQSIHTTGGPAGRSEAAICGSCHGDLHVVLPLDDPASPIHGTRLPDTCGACHADPARAEQYDFHLVRPIEAYRASVHARAVEEGKGAATCSSCHGSHFIVPAADPESRVHRGAVPGTCGHCHVEITAAYESSVHGLAARHGVREAPVCTDCHGEHIILSPREGSSPVFAGNIPKAVCGRCHEDLRLVAKFGLPADKVSSYEDSYHGLASRAGVATVAHCGSCHGVHDILPSSDPRSHVHADNLAATCGQCHPGAGASFAIGPVHIQADDPARPEVYWVRRIYLWLIFLLTGGMVAHNLLDLWRKVRTPPARPSPTPVLPDQERMSLGFRWAHGLVAGSFALLVYSGFALKYPESWWAQPLLVGGSGFDLRGFLHRSAALLMLGAVAFHLVHLWRDRKARSCIAQMRPRWRDVREFRDHVAYLLGRRAAPPKAVKLGYPEKVEYLALMWGIAIMSVTGFVLWFETAALRWLPKWASDVATVIHFYEAILATLAILVWHFYFVIFDPVVYPMDTAWLTGRSPAGRRLERDG